MASCRRWAGVTPAETCWSEGAHTNLVQACEWTVTRGVSHLSPVQQASRTVGV